MSKELFIASSPHETKVAVLEDDDLVEVYHERDTGWALVGSIYKGRVTRVLPGMQSAFVDIGLERDAFLYVSDFFEDSEEYEKVVSEAEARVGRVTAAEIAGTKPSVEGQTEGRGVSPVEGGSGRTLGSVTQDETQSPAVESVATPASAESSEATSGGQGISPPAPEPPTPETSTAAAPPVTPAQDASARSSVPPTRTGQPPERQGYGQRGRRRRRRGRGGFGEQKFTPHAEPRAEPREGYQPGPHHETPREFQILPGESLAKYSHAASDVPGARADEALDVVRSPEMAAADAEVSGPEATQQPASGETEFTGISLGSREAEASETQTAPSSDERGEATTVLTGGEAAARTSESAPLPAQAASMESGPAAQTRAAEGLAAKVDSRSSDLPTEELHAGPVTPAAEPTIPATSFSLGETHSSARLDYLAATEPEAVEVSTEESPVRIDQIEPGESVPSPVEDVGGTPEFEEVTGSEAETEAEEGALAEQDESGEEASAAEGGSGETPPAQTPADRSYTLREPQQRRPRFAPRRGRRGRRGPSEHRPRPASEAPRPSGNNQAVQISELLKEGQEILVQIAKEPLGTKGARITSHVALPGRYLVYMPTIHHIGVSRKIASEDERLRLRNIILENRGPLTGGFIVRTAGQGRSEDEFKADLRFLTTLWNEIRAKFERVKAPAILHRDLDLTQRILRDILSPDFKRVRVDNEVEYERIVDFVSRCQPALLGHVKLYGGDNPMFDEFGIQAEIDKALKPKVWLKSGGFIVINQTEALVAIDVNTGKYVGKTNRLEDTIVKTNIDAVREIVRQIRLRDLGGIIVVDFIDMDERRNRYKVVQALEEALRHDRAPTNILSINEFGLVALTRKRVKQSLERTLCEPCHYCGGSGWIKSVTTVCYEILSEARKMASQIEGKVITLRVNPEVARALKSREGVLLSELESLTRKDIVIRSDATVQQERFEIF